MKHYDLVIVGTGIAGLSAALQAAKSNASILLVTKTDLRTSSSELAQGGIAAAIGDGDDPAFHLEDTLMAGSGICDPKAVQILVTEGQSQVQHLLKMGVPFEAENGKVHLGHEAAHSKRRILHAGDQTGAMIQKSLGQQILKLPQIEIWQNRQLIQIHTQDQEYRAASFWDRKNKSFVQVSSKALILCTGGYGQIYRYNSNPEVNTGDGIWTAYLAGARLRDMEFVQFHPTTLYLGDKQPLSLFLISEAVRGEGAVIRNIFRQRFMPNYDSRAELAPRDIVARSIWKEMHKTLSDHVLLDFSGMQNIDLAERFPSIYYRCMQAGIDITRDLVPVAPAAHYSMGGIQTDLWAESSVKNLFAAGECASSGVHGANRLASNSLLEGLVFGARAAKKALERNPAAPTEKFPLPDEPLPESLPVRIQIQNQMWEKAGIVRSPAKLKKLEEWLKLWKIKELDYETRAMLGISKLLTQAALQRTESRGAHFREDFPNTDDRHWKKSIEFGIA